MGIKLISARKAIQKQGIKLLVYGPAGSGKTYMCATCPDHSRTLIVSAESGLLSLQRVGPDIPVAVVNGYSDVLAVLQELKTKKDRFDWVCLDSISEIAETCLIQEKARGNTLKAYGEMADTMLRILRDFRNLKCNVVMTAKQKRLEDQNTGVVSFVPMLPGRKLSDNIAYIFDEVFALTVEENRETGLMERKFQTQISPSYEAKDRSGALDFHEPPNLAHVADKIMNAVKSKDESNVA